MTDVAIVRNGVVEGVAHAPDETWAPPEGATAVSIPHGVSVGPGYGCTGSTFSAPPVAAVNLGALKSELKQGIDAVAEATRLRFITGGVGQAMEYQASAEEAAAVAEDPSPDPADYPMLAASIGVDIDPDTGAPASDVVGVGRAVRAAQAAWTAVGAVIRGIRLDGKAAVDTAPDATWARTAADAALAALGALDP